MNEEVFELPPSLKAKYCPVGSSKPENRFMANVRPTVSEIAASAGKASPRMPLFPELASPKPSV